MSERVRIGVVGTSWWADHFHLAKLKALPGADLVAICGRNRTRAEEMAAKHAIPQIYSDYAEMIARGNLQALVVAAPDDLHYPITMAALDAGLHVLCEKPFAQNAAQARAMLEKAQAAGVKHMLNFTYRYMPFQMALKRLVDEGFIGRCHQVNLRFVGNYGPQYRWCFDPNRGTGILGELGSHIFDLARWYVGDIAQVSGQLSTFTERPGPDGQPMHAANDAAMVALRFANGAQGVIQLSAVAQKKGRGHYQEISLYGEEGTLELALDVMGGGPLRGLRKGEKEFQTLAIPADLWGANSPDAPFDVFKITTPGSDFIASIQTGRTLEPTFLNGYRSQQVIDAVFASDREGRWESLNHD